MFVAFEVDGTVDNADVDGLRDFLSALCSSDDVVYFCVATLVAEGAIHGLCVGLFLFLGLITGSLSNPSLRVSKSIGGNPLLRVRGGGVIP